MAVKGRLDKIWSFSNKFPRKIFSCCLQNETPLWSGQCETHINENRTEVATIAAIVWCPNIVYLLMYLSISSCNCKITFHISPPALPPLPQITPRISHLSLRHDFFRRDLVRLLCCRGDIKDINPQALCCPDQQISHDLTRSNWRNCIEFNWVWDFIFILIKDLENSTELIPVILMGMRFIVQSLPSMLCWEAVGHLEAHGGQVGHEEGVVGGVDGDARHPSQGHCAQVRRNHHHCCREAILQTAGCALKQENALLSSWQGGSWLRGGREDASTFSSFLPPNLFTNATSTPWTPASRFLI